MLVFIFGAGFGWVSVFAPTMGGPYLGCGTKPTLRMFFFGIFTKNCYKNVPFVFRSELDTSHYGGSRPM